MTIGRDAASELPPELASVLRDVPAAWDPARILLGASIAAFWVAVAILLAVYA